MKLQPQWYASALAVLGGLVLAGSASAQGITGTPYLSNVLLNNTSPNALYAGWATSSTITSTSTGVEVSSGGYGSCYYAIPVADQQVVNTADALVTLIFTVNSPTVANINWMGTPFILDDSAGNSVTYGGYSASGNAGSDAGTTWNGNIVTETETFSSAMLASVQAGGDIITGFNLEVDPASFNGPPLYDITFNSLTLSPVPEPGSMALFGVGLSGVFLIRRRLKMGR